MRQIFLWASRQRWLADLMTRRAFARRAVRRFMPGEDVAAAFAAAEALAAKRVAAVFTQLGENITQLSEARAVADHYRSVLARSGGTAR